MNFVSKWKLSFKENYKLGVAYKEGFIQFSVLFSEKRKASNKMYILTCLGKWMLMIVYFSITFVFFHNYDNIFTERCNF